MNEPTNKDDAELIRLAKLPKLEYERQRKEAAEKLGIGRLSALDSEVNDYRKQLKEQSLLSEIIDDVEPWESTVNGNELAIGMCGLFEKHCILPKGGAVSITLWCMATYAINSFRIFPKLCLSSPTKRCGKSTTMDVIGGLSSRSLSVSNTTSAALFRAIEHWRPSLLIDEGDTFLSGNEELRGIINSGHKRSGAFVLRVNGEGSAMEPKRYSTWAPMAIAMIKTPPETIKDRSLMILLRRKEQKEKIQKLPIETSREWVSFRQKCQRWYNDNKTQLENAEPEIPHIGNDRAEDNWLPILAIADLLGGDWPIRARKAMQALEGYSQDDEDTEIMLLGDIQRVFIEKEATKITSNNLIEYLNKMDERPWSEWRKGKPMNANSLARILKSFSVKSKNIKFGGSGKSVLKGYTIADLNDAFTRYLPNNGLEAATPLPTSNNRAYRVAGSVSVNETEDQLATLEAAYLKESSGVAACEPDLGASEEQEVINL